MRPSRDEVYLGVAYCISQRGTCARRRVGCVLVDEDGFILSTGYNGVAAGQPHCTDYPCRGTVGRPGEGLDLCEALHAEQNAIIRLPDPRRLHTVYTTASPCISCIKLFLGTTCRRIVFGDLYPHPDAQTWWERDGREWIHLPLPRDD